MSGCQEEAAAIAYGKDMALQELKGLIVGDICEVCDNLELDCNCNVKYILNCIDALRGE